MELDELEKRENLEEGMQSLFDATVVQPTAQRLHHLARGAAQVPASKPVGFSPLVRHALGLACMVMGVALLPLNSFLESAPGTPETLSLSVADKVLAFDLEAENKHGSWDGDLQGAGFDLLHAAGSIDDKVLEESFQALLNENI